MILTRSQDLFNDQGLCNGQTNEQDLCKEQDLLNERGRTNGQSKEQDFFKQHDLGKAIGKKQAEAYITVNKRYLLGQKHETNCSVSV